MTANMPPQKRENSRTQGYITTRNTATHFLPKLPTFTTGTCQKRMLPYVKPNKHLPTAQLPVDAQHQLESFYVGSPGDEMRPRSAPYGGAPETTRKLALPNPLPESTTIKFRTCKFPVFPPTATNHPLSRIATPLNAYRQTEASRS